MTGEMDIKDFVGYIIAQCLGAFCGSTLLALIFNIGYVTDMTGGLGANGLSGVHENPIAGLAVEIVLTFFLCLQFLVLHLKKQTMDPLQVL